MRQITVLLALASPERYARLRSEVVMDPELVLVGEARTPAEAIAQTRRHEPQIVLCDGDMLADGQMAVLTQQTLLVSLLVLVVPGDESWLPQLPVPVAGTISFYHRPGTLVDRLEAIINAPAASVELPMPREYDAEQTYAGRRLEPIAYEPSELPSLESIWKA
jgi:DNA-binding NarL/FixJ family response regulator